jgi:hypothetical protein
MGNSKEEGRPGLSEPLQLCLVHWVPVVEGTDPSLHTQIPKEWPPWARE